MCPKIEAASAAPKKLKTGLLPAGLPCRWAKRAAARRVENSGRHPQGTHSTHIKPVCGLFLFQFATICLFWLPFSHVHQKVINLSINKMRTFASLMLGTIWVVGYMYHDHKTVIHVTLASLSLTFLQPHCTFPHFVLIWTSFSHCYTFLIINFSSQIFKLYGLD